MENEIKEEIKEEQSEQKHESVNTPLGVKLNAARADMTIAILEVQKAYGLPAYITDLIVSACLSDIRDCANKELINA